LNLIKQAVDIHEKLSAFVVLLSAFVIAMQVFIADCTATEGWCCMCYWILEEANEAR
jgi:hypothetical protein